MKYYATIFDIENDPMLVQLESKTFDQADEEVLDKFPDACFTWIFDEDSLAIFKNGL